MYSKDPMEEHYMFLLHYLATSAHCGQHPTFPNTFLDFLHPPKYPSQYFVHLPIDTLYNIQDSSSAYVGL